MPYLTPLGKQVLIITTLWASVALLLALFKPSAPFWPILAAASALGSYLFLAFLYASWIHFLWVQYFYLKLLSQRDFAQIIGHPPLLHAHQDWNLHLRLFNPFPLKMPILKLWLLASSHFEKSEPLEIVLPPNANAQIAFSLKACHMGQAKIFGLHYAMRFWDRCFELRFYQKIDFSLHIRPSLAPLPLFNPFQTLKHSRVQGLYTLDLPGHGLEFREIREHQYGDPFRWIAWKATARTGQLMVRQFECQSSKYLYWFLDISPSMRIQRQKCSPSPLERAISWISQSLLTYPNDKIGLLTFSSKVHAHFPPKSGKVHLHQLLQHLWHLDQVIDEHWWAWTEEEAAQALAHYLMLHFQLDFRKPKSQALNLDLLKRWLQAQAPKMTSAPSQPSSIKDWVRHFGLNPALKREMSPQLKSKGLVHALNFPLALRQAHLLLIVSDFQDLERPSDALIHALTLAQRKHHRIHWFILKPSPTSASDWNHWIAKAQYDAIHRALKAWPIPIQVSWIPPYPLA